MTHKEHKELEKQLKMAGRCWREKMNPDPALQERMEARLMSYIAAHGSQTIRPLTLAERTKLAFGAKIRVFSPNFAYAAVIFALFSGVAATAMVSRNALPGDTLYGAKLAAEQAKVRFTSNPASRARVQIGIAGNRLREAHAAVAERGAANGRVDEALNRFARDVEDATNTLKQAGDPQQIKAATEELASKVSQYRQELAETKVLLEQAMTEGQQSPALPVDSEPVILGDQTTAGDDLPAVDNDLADQKPARIVELASLDNAEKALADAEKALGVGEAETGKVDGLEDGEAPAGEVSPPKLGEGEVGI